MLLMAIEAIVPRASGWSHLFLDNARYHPLRETGAGMAGEARVPGSSFTSSRPTAPHLNPYRTTMGVDAQAHHPQQVATPASRISSIAMLTFLRDDVPRNWDTPTATESRTTSESSTQRIFGFSRERGIIYLHGVFERLIDAGRGFLG